MAKWQIGSGFYQWVDLEGELRTGSHWDELPAEMDRLVAFIPAYPEGAHSEAEHTAMATFNDRLQAAMKRCRR